MRLWKWCSLCLAIPILAACNRSAAYPSVTEEFYAMDTAIRVSVYGERAQEAVRTLKEETAAFEERFSVTRDESELARLNQNGGQAFKASDDLLAMLEGAKRISERSGGAFDVTIYPVMKAWGFDRPLGGGEDYRVPASEELDECLKAVGADKIEVGEGKVRLAGGATVDLGGIAKGYLGRLLKERLKGMGIESAILSLGGNVQTLGSKPERGEWTVGVTDPHKPDELLGSVRCGETAVVTSGTHQRNFTKDGVFYHHIMDPKTGRPVENELASVTVLCEDGMEADALSTALFVLGKEGALAYYERYQGFEAILVTKEKEVVLTQGIRDSFLSNE